MYYHFTISDIFVTSGYYRFYIIRVWLSDNIICYL